jgi:hypothetical protein
MRIKTSCLIPTFLMAGMLIMNLGCKKDKVVENMPPAQKGFEDCLSSSYARAFMVPTINENNPQSYTVGHNLLQRTHDFYDTTKNWPINQSTFGICETCSSMGMLGYALENNTNHISPLYTLFKAYNYPIPDKNNVPQPFYLWGDPVLGHLWNFLRETGYVGYTGQPANSGNVFTELCDSLPLNANHHPDYTKLPPQFQWKLNYSAYQTDSASVTVKAFPGIVDSLILGGNTTVFSGTLKSDKIAHALDEGYIVLIMFHYLYLWNGIPGSGADLFSRYSYNNGQLEYVATSDSAQLNVWSLTDKLCYEGETHWVYIFSYATAADGSKIFFIRNSWGNKRGENGNYYMTEGYLNGSYRDLVTGNATAILSNFYGYKISNE